MQQKAQNKDFFVFPVSWFCKNTNRSQAEQLLKTEVKLTTDLQIEIWI